MKRTMKIIWKRNGTEVFNFPLEWKIQQTKSPVKSAKHHQWWQGSWQGFFFSVVGNQEEERKSVYVQCRKYSKGMLIFIVADIWNCYNMVWRKGQIDTWTIGVRTEKKTAYHLLIAALFSGLHTDFYRLNKIASLQLIQYGVWIDFLLDFTKESIHWKLIPAYIQK